MDCHSSRGSPIFSHTNHIIVDIFSCSMSLSISQVTTTTTTPSVMVVCSRIVTMNFDIGAYYCGPTSIGQHDIVLPTQFIPRDTMRGSGGNNFSPTCLPQGSANYALGPPEGKFLFQIWALHRFLILMSYGACFQLLGSHVASMFTSEDSEIGVFTATTLWKHVPLAGIYASWWGLGRVTWSLHHPYMVGRGHLFQVVLQLIAGFDCKSMLDVKPDYSGVMISYKVDEFTCPLSAEHFVSGSHISP